MSKDKKKKKKERSKPVEKAPLPASAALAPAAPWTPGGAVRIAVGLVLLVSGLMKVTAPATEFAAVIESYYILPPEQALTAAKVLPPLQLLTGLAMVLGYRTKAASAVSALLFALFIGALGSVLFRGIPLTDCGCFGWGLHLAPAQTIILDALLLSLALLAFKKGEALALLDAWISQGDF